ncbi:hypothetical protein V2A60_007011 [Cordyceps javanica]|uniref:Glycine-rich cell wall structural protein 1 n=1 Tax=Cordyceps javanica TaxID=43265 RepID=A0A545US93_9HYPO|nr:glycine-rich cell wall structural protein 1 [Cordyceps javanica]TQW04434.1 glycine-rich cell wall structural protein 1 [Cordyceps javanica]
METISQMATSAAKYAFGDSSNQEPLSGSQGDVNKGEPYDAGNLDPSDQERIRQGLSSSESRDVNSTDGAYTTSSADTGKPFNSDSITSGGSNSVLKGENTGRITTATNATNDAGFTHPQHDMSAPGRNTSGEDNRGGITTSTNRTTGSDFTSPGQDMGGSARSASGLDSTSSSHHNDRASSKNQELNATGDNLASQDLNRADDASSANIDSKSKPSEKPSTSDDEPAVDVSGPGPRDLSTVARENGGDAGSHNSASASHSSSSKQPATGSDLPADQSQEKGTGEMYVKSSGLQADGGDFDATKPGAGREADRLMEEKGISTSSSGGKDKGSESADHHHKSSSSGSEGKEKHSIVDKIKEKLHKH